MRKLRHREVAQLAQSHIRGSKFCQIWEHLCYVFLVYYSQLLYELMKLGVFLEIIPTLGPQVVSIEGIGNHTNTSSKPKLNVSPTQLYLS